MISFLGAAALMTMGIILIAVGVAMFLDEVSRGVKLARDSEWKGILIVVFIGSMAVLGAVGLVGINVLRLTGVI